MKQSLREKIKNKFISKPPQTNPFTIVAIGASSGGLDALCELLEALSPGTGMAYIIVQHLSQDHKSFLTELLMKRTSMKVQEIEDMELMKPDNVYVIPYDRGIIVTDGHIKLIPRSQGGKAITIDVLFDSLALTHKSNVIGIVLSGTGSDGTGGLRSIKNAGGVTYAQDNSAAFTDMPHAAINSGIVDFILAPVKIAEKLNQHINLPIKQLHKEEDKEEVKQNHNEDVIDDYDPGFAIIFEILHKAYGVDFSAYKMATIKRRTLHRMAQCHAITLNDYIKFLKEDNKEANLLYKDLLINVTSFFRNPETFQYLKSKLLPKILKKKKVDEPFRIWIPACSTGEEVYSIAIILTEIQKDINAKIPVQIFATDLSERAIADARIGEYSSSDVQAISQERLNEFFTKTGITYRVNKVLREMCVFAPHNVLRDPPFSRVDMVSCCNLLIYFDPAAQKKALTTFHFALKDEGVLLLGKSESIGASQLFTPIDTTFKVFSKKQEVGPRKLLDLQPHFPRIFTSEISKSKIKDTVAAKSTNLDSAIDAVLLWRYIPASVIINKDMEILQFRGKTDFFLKHPSGIASLNILKMTRPEFAFELRHIIQQAFQTENAVIKSGIEVNIDSSFYNVSIEASRLPIEWDEPLLLIVFEVQENEVPIVIEENLNDAHPEKDKKIKKLIEELHQVRTEMHSYIQMQDIANENLQSANEETSSANEELQTLNEELETSKEELESTNEELITINQELQVRNEMLAESHEYSEAIVNTIHEPLIILDKALFVKSANKAFYKKFHTDKETIEGKSFLDIGNRQWATSELYDLLSNVISKNIHFDNLEVNIPFPNEGLKTLLLNAHSIIQKNHRDQLILLAIEDITERKEAEKSKDDFIGFSSHELRTPLTGLKAYLELAQKDLKINKVEKLDHYITRSNKLVEKLNSLIGELHDITKAEADKFQINRHWFNFDEFLTHLIETQSLSQQSHKIERIGAVDVYIFADEFRLAQVFTNYLSNAIKYSPGKDKVVVSVEIKDKDLVVGVRDFGSGIARDKVKKVFGKFFRSEKTKVIEGLGLGLYIAKAIINKHSGEVWVESVEGEGSTFYFSLPVDGSL